MRKRFLLVLLLTVGALFERPVRSQAVPTVRIGLTQNASTVALRSADLFTIQQNRTRTAKFTMVLSLDRTFTGALTKANLQYRTLVEIDGGRLFVLPPDSVTPIDTRGAPVEVDNRTYRGKIEVFGNSRNTFTVVNELPLEDYLLGVVPNELSPA